MCKVRNNLIFKGKGEAGTHCDWGRPTAQMCDVYIGAPHLEGPCPHWNVWVFSLKLWIFFIQGLYKLYSQAGPYFKSKDDHTIKTFK